MCLGPRELRIFHLAIQTVEAYSVLFYLTHQIATAVKFLQNSRVRQSPLATRRAFLKKKGTGSHDCTARLGTGQEEVTEPTAGAERSGDLLPLCTAVGLWGLRTSDTPSPHPSASFLSNNGAERLPDSDN